MSHALRHCGGSRYAVYQVAYNADLGGTQTRVRFAARDRWVDSDYWQYQGEIQVTRMHRARWVMHTLEVRAQTDRYLYQLARAIALAELGHKTAAQHHLQIWKEQHNESYANGNV